MRDLLDLPILTFGETRVTAWSVIYYTALLVALFYIAGKIRRLLVSKILVRSKLDIGAQEAVATITRYVVVLIGLLIIIQTAGIDLTTLNVIAGAVGFGIGFGLQNIASNFISGLIILFERPIKIGDRIEVSEVEGEVISIGARSTTVVTNDNIAIIVPNSKFVTENVVNWQYVGNSVRFKVPVTVAGSADPRLVEKLLLVVAAENPDVLDVPEPAVRFLEFAESGLKFELRAWSSSLVHRKGKLISALNFAILEKFRENEIEIPNPPRDIYLRNPIELKQ